MRTSILWSSSFTSRRSWTAARRRPSVPPRCPSLPPGRAGPRPAVTGLRIDASAYLVRYFDAEDFDQAGLRAGGGYEGVAGAAGCGPGAGQASLNSGAGGAAASPSRRAAAAIAGE